MQSNHNLPIYKVNNSNSVFSNVSTETRCMKLRNKDLSIIKGTGCL